MSIRKATKKDYKKLQEVWELSVRASLDFFLNEEIIAYRDIIISDFFPFVDIDCYENEKAEIVGFIGVARNKIEMFFIEPNSMGKGIGRKLLEHAIKTKNATHVDVNEENPKALGFYEHCGFKVIDRSELDSEGGPHPLLHMQLKSSLSSK